MWHRSQQPSVVLSALRASTVPFLALCVLQSSVNAVETEGGISIWVDNAPLELVVSQLAVLGGKQLSADSVLQGQISGRFNGSVETTLNTIAESHDVLFDMSDDTLNAVDAKQKSTATVALGGDALDVSTKASLLANVMGGNDVLIRDAEVVVSGHPSFVKRTAMAVTAHLAKAGQERLPKQAESVTVADSNTVIDTGAQALVEDMKQSVEQERDTATLSTPIRWVSDIPGFNTF